jgi:hypothetical protein
MSASSALPAQPSAPAGLPAVRAAVVAVLGAWLAVVVLLGRARAFDAPPGTPPLAIVGGVAVPLAVFFAALALSKGFRAWVLALDPRVTAALQAWRFAGFVFLALYVHGVLPGRFAIPAGLGDMAIAVAAPWILVRLLRDPGFAASRTYVAWNVLGLLDLAVAMTEGGLGALLATGASGEVTTAPMAHLPLLLIPAWLVPLFAMLHAAALLQARRLRSTTRTRT